MLKKEMDAMGLGCEIVSPLYMMHLHDYLA
jgi:hypothetical protein